MSDNIPTDVTGQEVRRRRRTVYTGKAIGGSTESSRPAYSSPASPSPASPFMVHVETESRMSDEVDDSFFENMSGEEVDAVDLEDRDTYKEEILGRDINGQYTETWGDEVNTGDSGSADGMDSQAKVGTMLASRTNHLPYSTILGIKTLASGGRVAGISSQDGARAIYHLEKTLGGSAAEWAKELKVDGSMVALPTSEGGLNEILSTMGKTSEEYLKLGPGSKLANHTLLSIKQEHMDSSLEQAVQFVNELAHEYIDPRSGKKGSAAYDTRHRDISAALTKRFMYGSFSEQSNAILPMPNETGVTGIKATQGGKGAFTGTPFTRLEFARYAEDNKLTEEDGADFWKYMPNLARSLFPIGSVKGSSTMDLKKADLEQTHRMQSAYKKARYAREVFLQQTPTHADESAGRKRTGGFYSAYGEQFDKADILNEAGILDLDYGQRDVDEEGQPVITDEMVRRIGKGSDRSNGNEGLEHPNEVGAYLERRLEEEPEGLPDIEGIRQRTPEWHKAREGMITASKLINKGGRLLTSEELAVSLAEERLGIADPFVGNAHTREGVDGEPKVLAAFLSAQRILGNKLEHTEVGLLQNKAYDGFGASPDGRLKGKGGSNEGLLELKYLTSTSLEGAVEKYTPQVQLQMAITGEAQTHFFAYDKYTDESIHEIIYADEDMQKDIFDLGMEAFKLERKLGSKDDIEDFKNMSKSKIKTKEQRLSGEDTEELSGQQLSFSYNADVDTAMIPFRHRAKADIAGRIAKQVNKEKESSEERALKEAWSNSDPAQPHLKRAESDARSKQAEVAERNKQIEVTKETTKSLKELGKSSRTTAAVMLELSKLMTKGSETALEENTLAKSVGLDASEARGMRKSILRTGMTNRDADNIITSAGKQVGLYNSKTEGAENWAAVQANMAKSDFGSVNSLETMDFAEVRALDAQEYASYARELTKVLEPEAKVQALQYLGFDSRFAAYTEQGGSSLDDVDQYIDTDGATEQYQGNRDVEEQRQRAQENTGSNNKATGLLAGVMGVVGDLMPTAVNSLGLYGLYRSISGKGLGKGLAGKGLRIGSMASAAWKFGGKAARVGRVVSPSGAVLVGSSVARSMAGIEDDGGKADTSFDVLESAAWGAGAGATMGLIGGPLAPVTAPMGALVGGIAGTVYGLGKETYQYLNRNSKSPEARYRTKDSSNGAMDMSEDSNFSLPDGDSNTNYYLDNAIPSTNLGPMSNSESSKSTVVNHIQVTTTVEPGYAKTEVIENGDRSYIDEENSF
jgi:hypothetical protein